LAKKNVVRVGGLFVAEIDFAAKANELDGWTLLRDRTYGKTRILIWRRIS
jgi:16S rRNA G966 N2-methylase RsmD